ncbi:hypothetical protein NE237_021684 [Protea cynaroides]|uniref:Uncharacterized protein n=1 Tax=Protea cynaroides TaxID=273540 RepID=A0A9Q0K2U6_9MAGN|nr:hypothetical protein NE237_021684 [Protea cynaroides]
MGIVWINDSNNTGKKTPIPLNVCFVVRSQNELSVITNKKKNEVSAANIFNPSVGSPIPAPGSTAALSHSSHPPPSAWTRFSLRLAAIGPPIPPNPSPSNLLFPLPAGEVSSVANQVSGGDDISAGEEDTISPHGEWYDNVKDILRDDSN